MNRAQEHTEGSARQRKRRGPFPPFPAETQPNECDLIMKGGITSGIVYPQAICTFARQFQLRSIGGASAGAIAAGAAAAAQYARNAGIDNGSNSFQLLATLPEQLAETHNGQTRLLQLFQPEAALRPLFRWLLDGLNDSQTRPPRAALRWLLTLPWRFPLAAAAGLLIALALAALLGAASPPWPGHWTPAELVLTLGLLLFGTLCGALCGLLRAVFRVLPQRGFGLCSGMPPAGRDAGASSDADAPLTPWLHGLLQALAGRGENDPPLTFGELWATASETTETPEPGALEQPSPRIDLRVMTTALSHGQPYSFPLPASEIFCFDEAEMRRLFPASLVEWLLAHPRRLSREEARFALPGRRLLPAMEDLPILLAIRMSLSFPLLLAAVPLYRLDVHRNCEEVVWFSDGGICSNFPVHFFDAPLPTRPTFAINLDDDLSVAAGSDPDDPRQWVRVPQHNGDGQERRQVSLQRAGRPSLVAFAAAIKETMHNWTDNSQLRVPGFRDRIAHVHLSRDEGGLNLRMSGTLIRRIARRGEYAAQKLIDTFLPQQPYHHRTTWQNHCWVRFRTSLTLLEQALEGVRVADVHHSGKPSAVEQLHAQPPSYSYRSNARRTRSLRAYRAILELASRLSQLRQQPGSGIAPGDHRSIFDPLSSPAPKPRSDLRIRPRL